MANDINHIVSNTLHVAFVTELGRSGRVLEIGSGGGRDALELEKRGLASGAPDISKGFVELLRESC
ncbi:MAG: SAM-dependent methyltransferase protein [Rhizobium sp.]|nr:SAM-dependent methyltransferase protein [Rhizobium sp.]